MANEILTRCGYRCDLCLAYKDNIQKDDKRELLREGWFKIFGIEMDLDDIYCDGCLNCNNDLKLIDSGCKVRPCVIAKGIENCSQCEDFPCNILEERLVRYSSLEKEVDFKISRTERKNFIKPYENYDRLTGLREKQGTHSRMYNQAIEPDFEDMTRFIGNEKVVSIWKEFNDYIDKYHNFNSLIKYGGRNYGWCINYRKGSRTMISIHPERHAFTVLYTFGAKELKAFEAIRDKISKSITEKIDETKKYHDGKWIWLRVTGESNFTDDLIKLLSIKSKPKKLA